MALFTSKASAHRAARGEDLFILNPSGPSTSATQPCTGCNSRLQPQLVLLGR